MVLPFEQFLRQVTGQGTEPVATPVPVPPRVVGNPDRFMWLGDDPIANPAVLQGQPGDETLFTRLRNGYPVGREWELHLLWAGWKRCW